jgi:hypothetical protein
MTHTTVVTHSGAVIKVPVPLNPQSMRGNAYDAARGIAQDHPSTVEACINIVADYHGVTVDEVMLDYKGRRLSRARQMAYMLAREVTGETYTTVRKGAVACANRLSRCDKTRDAYNAMKALFDTSEGIAVPIPEYNRPNHNVG